MNMILIDTMYISALLTDEEEETFQTKEVPVNTPKVTSGMQAHISAIRSGGQPLTESE